MRLHRAPLFAWASLVGSIALALVLPVAAGAHILQYVDYHYGGAAFGGSSGIWPWTSYLYTGPVLGIAAVFAAGFVADLVAVTFRRRLPQRGIALIGIGLIGTAAWAGVAQQDVITLPGTGTEVRLDNFATKLGFLAHLGDDDAATGARGGDRDGDRRPRRQAAAGRRVDAAQPQRSVHLRLLRARPRPRRHRRRGDRRHRGPRPAGDRVRGGGVGRDDLRSRCSPVSAPPATGSPRRPGASCRSCSSAASPRWAPSAGRWPPCRTSSPASSISLAARRRWSNDGPGEVLNALVVAGHAAFGLTALAFVGLVAKAWRSGDAAGDDPWSGETLEWATTSPPPPDNFATTPTVMSPEPLLDLKARPEFVADEAEAS